MARPPKYSPEVLIPVFRKAAAFRDEMLAAGFTDNGGAIHSAERILNILGQRLKYPGLSHINSFRHHPAAEFSEAAWEVHRAGGAVQIEHVSPLRHLTREAIRLVTNGATDAELVAFILAKYRLTLLTRDEMAALNKVNRSRMTEDRLFEAGIAIRRRQDMTSTG